MQISQNGINLIKRFEGLDLTAYRDNVNVLTIGWGHTEGVTEGETITESQAEKLLEEDLQIFVEHVNELVKVPINQNQFDALVSFAFNEGWQALAKSTLLKFVNESNFEEAANEFLRWDLAGGKVLPGLEARREKERSLFLTPVKTEVIKEKPTIATVQSVKPGRLIEVVASGQTLSEIASKVHIPVHILANYNSIANEDEIEAGQRLSIPKVIEVRSGDTLTNIALLNKETVSFLAKVNSIENPNVLRVGQTLYV